MKRTLIALALSVSLLVPAAADYVDHITGHESGGDYAVYNTLGHTEALGRYQFIPSTFADQGYMTYKGGPKKSWSSYEFNGAANAAGVDSVDDLRHTDAGHALQDAAFDRFTNSNWTAISSGAKGYVGSTVNGAPITQEGLLSAAHFLGAQGVNDWIEAGFDASALPWNRVTANGFSSYAELQEYLLKRVSNAAGETWNGSGGSGFAESYGDDGMYDSTEGFPGLGSKRPTLIQEVPPFQGRLKTLTGGSQ